MERGIKLYPVYVVRAINFIRFCSLVWKNKIYEGYKPTLNSNFLTVSIENLYGK